MHKTSIRQKASQFHAQIARKKRQQIIAKRREQLFKSSANYQVRSQIFEKYSQIPEDKLYLHRDELFDTLDDVNGQQLTEQESQEFCNDLLHFLMNDSELIIPYTMKFRKDQSLLTATVVSFVYECIDTQEGNYWLRCMNEECRSAIYINLQCGEDVSKIINDQTLLATLVQDWGHLPQAQQAIAYLLDEIEIDTQEQFLNDVYDKLHQMNKNALIKYSEQFILLLVRLIIHFKSNNAIFQYLIVILNEGIYQMFNQNPKAQLNEKCIAAVDILLQSIRFQYRIVFTSLNFQFMLKMMINLYNRKYLNNKEAEQRREKFQPQYFKNIQSNVINRIINICMNHLRVHRSLKYLIAIDPSLINAVKPLQSFGPIQEKYQKLVTFNNVYQHQKITTSKNENIGYDSYGELQI